MSNQVTQAPTHIPGVADLSDNNTTVYSGAAQIVGVLVHTTLSAHDCPIEDGTNGTAYINIPASTAAGTWIECGNMTYGTSIYVDPDDSATGQITVVYTPNHDGQAGNGYSGGQRPNAT
jgi:hypothetical protein